MGKQVRRLDALTGLRFVAAAAVVLYHTTRGQRGGVRVGLPADATGDVALGPNGVGFFFVLSGFILAYVYPRLGSVGAVGRFLLARFARLWPAHVVSILASMVAAGAFFWPIPTGHDRWALLAVHLGMLQSWFPMHSMTAAYNGPSWSISTEFGFYLLFIPLVHNWPRTWWWKLPLATALPVGVACAANRLGWPWQTTNGQPSYEHFLYFHPLARVWLFALGMATALLWQRQAARLRVGPVVGTALEIATVGLVVAATMWAGTVGEWCMTVPALGLPANHLLYGCSGLVAVPFALLIFVFASQWGLLSRAAALPPMVLLGDISFGVYILHWPLLDFLTRHQAAFAHLPGWQIGVGYWGVLLLLAHWMYVAVERPARRSILGLWPAGGWGGVRGALAGLGRPRVVWQAVEAAAAVGVLAVVPGFVDRQTLRYVEPELADKLVRHAMPAQRGVEFGGDYRLRGATFSQADGGVQLRLVWQSLKKQPPWFHVWVQFTTAAPAEECLAAVVDARVIDRDWVLPGQQWEQRLFLPVEKMAGAANVVLIVWNKDETNHLPLAGGPQDAHGRLLLNPPASPGPAFQATAPATPDRPAG